MQVFAAVKCERMKNLVSHVKCFEMLSLRAKSGKPFVRCQNASNKRKTKLFAR